MQPPPNNPTNYLLSDKVAGYMRRRFCYDAFPGCSSTKPMPLFDISTEGNMAMLQIVSTMVEVHSNCGEWPSTGMNMNILTILPVQSGIDLIGLAGALSPRESGTKLEKEAQLLTEYPSLLSGYIDRPTVILGEGGTIAVWYLPGAVSRAMQVCTTITAKPSC